jgi:hypothetical protein
VCYATKVDKIRLVPVCKNILMNFAKHTELIIKVKTTQIWGNQYTTKMTFLSER